MSRYEGRRTKLGPVVTVDDEVLEPRSDLWNHSPDGFEWGYGGSGPAQLALAILAHHLDNGDLAIALHQQFKFAVVAKFPRPGWILTSAQIQEALDKLQRP